MDGDEPEIWRKRAEGPLEDQRPSRRAPGPGPKMT